MPTLPDNILYPFDPTGTLISNKIAGEQQIITAENFRDYHFIVPKLAPYFYDTLVMTYRDQNNNVIPLVEGIDWYATHWFISASRACAKPIYGSITFLNTSLAGVVTLSYQTLGGDWNIDEALMEQILNDRLHNPRITSWDEVSEMPYAFPPIDHDWDLVDMVGMSEVVDALADIRQAIIDAATGGGSSDLQAHLADFANPHRVTAAQAGLGNVSNFAIATDAQSVGTLNTAYMTPRGVDLAIGTKATIPLNTHINDESNPHNVTAAQVGTYTSDEIDTALAGKLGENDAAGNSAKLENLTVAELTAQILEGTAANSIQFGGKSYAEATDDILSGTAADSAKFNGMDLTAMGQFIDARVLNQADVASQIEFKPYTPSTGTLKIWTKVAQVVPSSTNPQADWQYLVAGTEALLQENSGLFTVRVKQRGTGGDPLALVISSLNGIATNARFGIAAQADGLNYGLYVETDVDRGSVVVTSLGTNQLSLNNIAATQVSETEPVGIVYTAVATAGYATQEDLLSVVTALTDTFTQLSQ